MTVAVCWKSSDNTSHDEDAFLLPTLGSAKRWAVSSCRPRLVPGSWRRRPEPETRATTRSIGGSASWTGWCTRTPCGCSWASATRRRQASCRANPAGWGVCTATTTFTLNQHRKSHRLWFCLYSQLLQLNLKIYGFFVLLAETLHQDADWKTLARFGFSE